MLAGSAVSRLREEAPPDNIAAVMLEHSISFRVRYPEADPMGYVHHSRYLQYFEMGRVELLRASGYSYARLEEEGILFVVVKAEVRYKAPARFDDELRLVTKITKRTGVRFEHAYQLWRGTTLLAEGNTTIACVDREGQLREIPAELRQDEE